MGLSPETVDRQEVWPFRAAWEACKQANGIKETTGSNGSLEDEDLARMGIEGFSA